MQLEIEALEEIEYYALNETFNKIYYFQQL